MDTLRQLLKQFNINEKIEATKIDERYFRKPDETLLDYGPLYSGELIAQERWKQTMPSIDFLQEMAKKTNKKVTVNKKGEWLMICGRDIFDTCITKHNNPKIKELVFVMNEYDECIGYGQVIAPIESKSPVIKRMFDIGDLLRRER